MSGYAVAQIHEIDEISDGRCPWRPVRFHFGITSFGVNAFTAHQVGDRLINEHDESQEHDLQEELYRRRLAPRTHARRDRACVGQARSRRLQRAACAHPAPAPPRAWTRVISPSMSSTYRRPRSSGRTPRYPTLRW
jgi:hypothetical protein